METGKGLSDKVESWLARIPGVGTYREKERRRETDKRVRQRLAARLDDARAYVGRVTLEVSQKGLIELLDELGRLSSHLQQLADTVRHASYGYAGIFDLEKIGQEQLERLCEFDLYLLDDAEAICEEVTGLNTGLPAEQWDERIRVVEERIEALKRRYNRRKEFMVKAG